MKKKPKKKKAKKKAVKKKPAKKKAGRPKKEFSQGVVRKIGQMAFDQCHTRTIAEVINKSQDTIKRHFASLLAKKRAEGRAAIRRSQMKTSKKNSTMQIWLGKQYLEQKDKHEVEHGVTSELSDLLGLIDGSSKGKLPDRQEAKDAGK